MREIKFRAWDKESEEMGEVLTIQFHNGEAVLRVGSLCHYPQIINLELMQYTGLKDKNGKDIYEGDIVRYQCNSAGLDVNKVFAIGEVCFGRGGFIINHHTVLFKEYLWSCGNSCTENGKLIDAEVIGNIYENPELLDK